MISSLLGLYGEKHHLRFEDQGYLVLGKLLSDHDLFELQRRADDLMMGRVRIPGITFQLDGEDDAYGRLEPRTEGPSEPSLNYRRIDELHLDPLYLAFTQHPVFRQITRRYIGEDVSVFRTMFMNKPARSGTVLPWHQDIGAGWGIDTNPTTTVWTALDRAIVENGCMQIVPGSHGQGILNERHYTSEEDQARLCKPDRIVDLEVEAGESVLLHNFLLHRSGINSTDKPRRAFSVTYMDAATRNVKTGDTYPAVFGRDALKVPVE